MSAANQDRARLLVPGDLRLPPDRSAGELRHTVTLALDAAEQRGHDACRLDRDHADTDLRQHYAATLGILDAGDTTPCWDDVVEAAEHRAEARIVAWLRGGKGALVPVADAAWSLAADMIERGKHKES